MSQIKKLLEDLKRSLIEVRAKNGLREDLWRVVVKDKAGAEVESEDVEADSAADAISSSALKDEYEDDEPDYTITAEKVPMKSWTVIFSATVWAPTWEADDQMLKEHPWLKGTDYTLSDSNGNELPDNGRIEVRAKVEFERTVEAVDEVDARYEVEAEILKANPGLTADSLSFETVY